MFRFVISRTIWLPIILTLVIMTGCAANKGQPAVSPSAAASQTPSEKVELTVSAAASLTDALKEIQTAYENTHKQIKLNFNFGASGALQQQIEQGAPADLFLSAAAKNLKTLVDKQLIDQSQQTNLLINELVVVIPVDSKAAVQKIEDVANGDIKHLAIGEPQTVPAGIYAKEALTKVQLWDGLQSKIVQAKDVRQVLTYVESGNAEAGFVYKTDALTSTKVKIAFQVDPTTYTPIEYPAGIVKATKHGKEAADFYSYLQSKEAQDVFVKFGFSIPK